MTNVDKFYSDVQRIKKYDRANNPSYDGLRASKACAQLFENYNRNLGDLPLSISNYWLRNYIEISQDMNSEPSDQHVQWLMTVLSFFDGNQDAEHDLPKKDWKAIMEFINFEAETLPIDILTSLMGVLVEKKVL
ncbi:MAG: hypothetical protein K5839_06775 [Treponemataceae bacterium]|nr:hypothetical protein [Treponemataceae bacterium]